MMKIISKTAGAVGLALVLAGVYLFVPPPQHARAQFADQGTWAGTAVGTANAVVLTLNNVSSLSDIVGVPIRFNPAANNTGPVTVAVTGTAGSTSATALQRPSSIGLVALSLNELWAGETTSVTYNGSVFVLSSNVDTTPIGKTVEFRGSSAPRGALIEDGSCVSQTQYAALFSVINTTYGSCSAGNFKLPLSNGTAFMALDGQGVNGLANRITATSCSAPNTLGQLCGSQVATLTPGLIPQITSANPSQSITVNPAGNSNNAVPYSANATVGQTSTPGTGVIAVPYSTIAWSSTTTLSASNSIAVTSSNTSAAGSVNHPDLNPVLLGIRAIKY